MDMISIQSFLEICSMNTLMACSIIAMVCWIAVHDLYFRIDGKVSDNEICKKRLKK